MRKLSQETEEELLNKLNRDIEKKHKKYRKRRESAFKAMDRQCRFHSSSFYSVIKKVGKGFDYVESKTRVSIGTVFLATGAAIAFLGVAVTPKKTL